jgi:hypothetical protein
VLFRSEICEGKFNDLMDILKMPNDIDFVYYCKGTNYESRKKIGNFIRLQDSPLRSATYQLIGITKLINSFDLTCIPYINYIEINDYKLEDMEVIFSEIIEELPIMRANIYGEEFVIKYNRWVDIKLTDTTKQIYRDIKLEKIFK